jgi:lysyl-tRNA synthetase class 2
VNGSHQMYGRLATVRRMGGHVGAVVFGILVVSAALGTLYLVRGAIASWPGPRIADALPLDELPRHDAVNVLPYLLVWGLAAAFLGGLARWRGMGRLTAAIVLSAAVMTFLYFLTGLSLYIVQGLGRSAVLRAPAHVRAVYVPPALAGIAGAFLGRRRRPGRLGPVVCACLVGVAGLLDILSAVTPEIKGRVQLVERLAPQPIPPLASAAVVPIGFVLVLAARGLARRKQRAWVLATWLLAGSTALHLLKGLDYEEAAITGLLALALFAWRGEFSIVGDPETRPRLAIRAVVLAGSIYAYGAIALWLNQEAADTPYSLGFAASETSRALFGLTIGGSPNVHRTFGAWFPLSVLLLGLVAMGWLLVSWLAPWRYRLLQERSSWEAMRSLVAQWGTDTLAPFVLRAEKSYFFENGGGAGLGYTVVAGVAVVSGDPIGPGEAIGPLLGSFIEYAHRRDWRITVLGASNRWLERYGAHGLRSIYQGDEAVIETARFSLEGRAVRKVRQSVHRLERAGFTCEIVFPRDVAPILRSELEGINRAWRGEQPAKGFAMALDSPFRLDGGDALFVIGRDGDGTPKGFLHFAVCRPGSALSLGAMPRRRDTPNGFNEWLITNTVAWAREHGFAKVSLNFAPFAALLDPTSRLSPLQRVQRDALLAMKSRFHFQLDNLLLFCRQFGPDWIPRFVVFERWTDLPRVGLAALAAEGYLPLGAGRAG